MKTQHTQGEWFAKDGQIYPLETGVTLATIPYFDKENEEQQANARLIAASPKLLEAVIWAKEQFEILANKGLYPEHLLAENGGDGIMILTNAINQATQ